MSRTRQPAPGQSRGDYDAVAAVRTGPDQHGRGFAGQFTELAGDRGKHRRPGPPHQFIDAGAGVDGGALGGPASGRPCKPGSSSVSPRQADHLGDRQLVGVAKAHVQAFDAEFAGPPPGRPVQSHQRFAATVVVDFHLPEIDPPEPGAQSLGDGLLGRKADRQLGYPAAAIGDFGRGEYLVQEPLSGGAVSGPPRFARFRSGRRLPPGGGSLQASTWNPWKVRSGRVVESTAATTASGGPARSRSSRRSRALPVPLATHLDRSVRGVAGRGPKSQVRRPAAARRRETPPAAPGRAPAIDGSPTLES